MAPLLSVLKAAIRIRTSLSTHGAFLVAFNAMEGYDAYDLNDGKVIGSFTREPLKHEVPILFDLDGEVVISGSTRDVLSIWCVKQRRQLEFLRMPSTLLLPCNCIRSTLTCFRCGQRLLRRSECLRGFLRHFLDV